jgi:hypothetical protein
MQFFEMRGELDLLAAVELWPALFRFFGRLDWLIGDGIGLDP